MVKGEHLFNYYNSHHRGTVALGVLDLQAWFLFFYTYLFPFLDKLNNLVKKGKPGWRNSKASLCLQESEIIKCLEGNKYVNKGKQARKPSTHRERVSKTVIMLSYNQIIGVNVFPLHVTEPAFTKLSFNYIQAFFWWMNRDKNKFL